MRCRHVNVRMQFNAFFISYCCLQTFVIEKNFSENNVSYFLCLHTFHARSAFFPFFMETEAHTLLYAVTFQGHKKL